MTMKKFLLIFAILIFVVFGFASETKALDCGTGSNCLTTGDVNCAGAGCESCTSATLCWDEFDQSDLNAIPDFSSATLSGVNYDIQGTMGSKSGVSTNYTSFSGLAENTTYTWKVRANFSSNYGSESTEWTDIYSFTTPVCAAPADLVISANSYSPSSPIAGDSMSFSGTVKNQGGSQAAASKTRLRIDIGNNGSYDVLPANQSTGVLNPGATETETWSNVWTATAGTHKYQICADATGAVAESNEGNNCVERTFTVTSATLSVDLKAATDGASWQDSLSGTAPLNGVDLKATVSGTAVGTINYTFYCNRSDSGTNITAGWDAKPDGTSINPYTVSNICNYSSAGTYTAKVIAERGGLAAEDRVTITVSAASTYTLFVNSSPVTGISISSSPSGYNGTTNYQKTSISAGTSISLTAPATHNDYQFSSWSGCNSVLGTGNRTCNVTMTSSKTVTATYICPLPTAPDLVSPANGSNIGAAPQTPTFQWTDSTGEDGYWVDLCTDSNCANYTNKGPLPANTTQTTWDSSLSAGTYWWRVYAFNSCGGVHSAIWSFTVGVPQYTLSVSKVGSGTITDTGINCGTDCTESYTAGTSVTLTASPASGWSFAGWSGDCSGTGNCNLTMNSDKNVTATFTFLNRAPHAKFSCSRPDCSAYSGSSDPALTLINESTDPDGEDDIVSCEWRNLDITGHDMTCPSWNILCNYVVQSTLLPPKDYDIELKVTDKAGASNALVKTIHIKTDAIADLRCSLNEAGPWQDCSDFKGIQGEYTYFKDTSTVSEGATFVRTRIWKINGTTFSSGTFPPDPVPTAKVKLPNRSNTIELTIEDNKGREDTTRYTFGAKLPLPEWKEIGP